MGSDLEKQHIKENIIITNNYYRSAESSMICGRSADSLQILSSASTDKLYTY